MKAFGLVLALLLGADLAGAATGIGLAPPPPLEFSQRLDAALPLELPFTDADGRAVRLGDYFGDGTPVVLVLGYYRCPNLCGLTMHGILEALAASGLARRDYRIVGVSIDPDETAADAQARQRVDAGYANYLRAGGTAAEPLDIHLLVGPAASITALARRVGFGYRRDAAAAASVTPITLATTHQDVPTRSAAKASGEARTGSGANSSDATAGREARSVSEGTSSSEAITARRASSRSETAPPAAAASRYVHAAGFVVVTPNGRTSRYLFGVRFEPRDLRLALVDAASGHIGTLSDRLLLLCAHFAPSNGRYDGAVMNLLRGVGAMLVLGLGGWAWRHRKAPAVGSTL